MDKKYKQMRNIIVATIIFSVICGNIFSQDGRKSNQSEQQAFEKKMLGQLKKITTLECAMQLETTSSAGEKSGMKGPLAYQFPARLRWEFTAPQPAILILNGPHTMLLDKTGKRNLANEKKLRELGTFIMMVINGKVIAQPNRVFSPEFHEFNEKKMLVILTPKGKMKDKFNKIELRIDPETMLANSISLDEKSGEKTIITLTNIVINHQIPHNKFEIQDDTKQ